MIPCLRHRVGAEAAVFRALVRHRPVGPRYLQPCHRGDPPRHLHCGGLGGAGISDGVSPGSPRDILAAGPDRIVGRIADTIMAFPLFVLAMGIVAALGNTVQNIHHCHRDREFPALRPRRPCRRPMCGATPASCRRRACRAMPSSNPFGAHPAEHHADHDLCRLSLTMGYAILNAAGLSFIGLGVRPPTAEWGIMVAEGAGFIGLGRMVDRAVSGSPR